MTKEELADAICGFLRDVAAGNSSCRLPVGQAQQLDDDPCTIGVNTSDDEGTMYFVEVQDV